MSIIKDVFNMVDQKKEVLRLTIHDSLLAEDAESLRKAIEEGAETEYDSLYIDVRDVKVVDLTGINEIINSSYVLKKVAKSLTLVYKKDSEMGTWVEKTGLDKFMFTALVP
jgi:anti-anti-sigma regulatory factor